jgi:succinate dehydrogenase / fumarate reductase cytochrome b subunit
MEIAYKRLMQTDTVLTTTAPLPQAYVWRRLHSLAGLWLTLYLILHLFTNSQAALLIGDDGKGFIRAVNAIHELPFLPLIEIAILAVPILIHAAWGIYYIRAAKCNSFGNPGNTPYLPEYPRNHRYTWQRLTSWVLLVGILAHVVHMRFIESPDTAQQGSERLYLVRVSDDAGLQPLAHRLGIALYDQTQLERQLGPHGEPLWRKVLKRPLKPHERAAVADNFGSVELLMVRDTFKDPLMLCLYTLLVLAACFHGFNGLWTFMISWGVTLSAYSQALMRRLSTFLMFAVAALGLSAIWLTYWVNLK